MTRSNAILYFNAWADKNLLRHGERTTGLDFVYDLYEDGFEVVDRKMSDEEIEKQMDESDDYFKKTMTEADYAEMNHDIADSMNFDNELSDEEYGDRMAQHGVYSRREADE